MTTFNFSGLYLNSECATFHGGVDPCATQEGMSAREATP
jgi:hypothetical protein